MIENYGTFDHMSQVVAHVKAGKDLYYWAPLDCRCRYVLVRPFGKVRVYIYGNADFDGFTADSTHLDRFYRRVG